MPQISNTCVLVDNEVAIFCELDVEREVIRIVDRNVAFGISSEDESGDE